MTQEEKELLLKDLCSRLRYGVKCYPVITNGEPNTIGGYCEILDSFYIREVDGWFGISMIKPYLRPMSSMTEEEKTKLSILIGGFPSEEDIYIAYTNIPYKNFAKVIDWLNSHHFDYRGLIEKGLALEAKEGMYVWNQK